MSSISFVEPSLHALYLYNKAGSFDPFCVKRLLKNEYHPTAVVHDVLDHGTMLFIQCFEPSFEELFVGENEAARAVIGFGEALATFAIERKEFWGSAVVPDLMRVGTLSGEDDTSV